MQVKFKNLIDIYETEVKKNVKNKKKVNSFKKIESVNTLTINKRCQIVDIKDYGENNKYYDYLIKAKLVQLLGLLKEGIGR